MKTVVKVLTALAAVAGVVYVVATFGDKIVAWAKSILPTCEDEVEVEFETEEAPVEEAVEEEVAAEETPVEEVIVEEAAPVADEADFEA